MNDTDQFDAMDEMSDWAVAHADLLAAMACEGRTRTAPDAVTPSDRPAQGGPGRQDPSA